MNKLVSLQELIQLVKDEITQRREEGYDVTEVEKKFSESEKKDVTELKGFLKNLYLLQV